jgi:hypothetical protein
MTHPAYIPMMRAIYLVPLTIGCGVAALLSGCMSMPTGPTVFVMPPPNKPFELFVQDDQYCRQWAAASIGSGRDAAANQLAASAVTGAAVGAIAGALAGGHNDAGAGAAIGTLFGSAVGTEQANATAWTAQRSYDVAYQQCMFSRGNVIPGYYPHGLPPSEGVPQPQGLPPSQGVPQPQTFPPSQGMPPSQSVPPSQGYPPIQG